MQARPGEFRKIMEEELKHREQIELMAQVGTLFHFLTESALNSYPDRNQARQVGRNIRERSLKSLGPLLETFESNARSNGMEVLWARDAEEGCRLIASIVKRHNVKIITKGKSMLSEEMDLNHYLEENCGVQIFEGDLGELIVQQRKTPPFHIVGPAINLKVPEIASILHEKIGISYTEDPAEIAGEVRQFLRRQFEKADMGITGVNFAVASSGSLVLVENEGNIRWSSSAPRIHLAIMSLEKVVEGLDDALHMMGLLTRSCTGQTISSYVSVLNGPRLPDEKDGPEKVYLLILDNGRSLIYKDIFMREALRCIRCGRCGTVCPVYLHIGAYPYGWCYPGPMGVVLTPLLLGLDQTQDLYEACTLCGACEEACPAGVPHLSLIQRYREMKAEGSPAFASTRLTGSEPRMFQLFNYLLQRPWAWSGARAVLRLYSLIMGRDGFISRLPGPAAGWFDCRDLPVPPAQSFHKLWHHRLAPELCSKAVQGGDAHE